ncbi:MAG: GGDEF domain-containing protein [Hyphomicrobiales bacterium]
MSQTGDYEKSIAQAHKALYLMVERRCPATPQNYELWYNYATGHDRSLVDQVDGALDDKGALAQSSADKIYDENLSPVRGMEEAMQITGQMSGEVGQVLNMLETAQGQTSAYGDSLGSVSQEIDGASDSTALKDIVGRLLSSTKQMEDNNRNLEERLQASHRQIAELNDNLTAAREESRTDQLTGISNRKAFDEMMKRLTDETIEERYDLCLLIGDIDHFKKFNDTFGHQTGDQVLRLVAGCLTSVLKGRDFAARYGGEEFAVLLPETSLDAAQTVGDHIRKTVMSKKLIKKSTGENLGVITMSFGGAKFRPGESIEQFIGRADECLYAAKDAGRNLVKCETDPDIGLSTNAA